MTDKSLAVTVAAPPGARPVVAKKPDIVLEEDEWTEKIEAIIERDYFPEITKAQSKLEWLQAIRSGDPELMRQVQLNIAQRRAGMRTPMLTAQDTPWLTAARPSTVAGAGQATPAVFLEMTPAPGRVPEGPLSPSQNPAPAAPVERLDQFMFKHTSEDNASFREILDKDNKRKRHKVEALVALVDGGSSSSSKVPRLEFNGGGAGHGGGGSSSRLAITAGPSHEHQSLQPGLVSTTAAGMHANISGKGTTHVDMHVSASALYSGQESSPADAAAAAAVHAPTCSSQQPQQGGPVSAAASQLTESTAAPTTVVTPVADPSASARASAQGSQADSDRRAMVYWPYVAKNRLFYDTSQAGTELQLSAAELAARVAGPPKEIKASNTRFAPDAGTQGTSLAPSTSATADQLQQPAPGSRLPDGRIAPEAQHGNPTRVYSYLDTPSMTPRPDASPIMTWGEIEGTPLRLPGDVEGDEGLLFPSEGGRTFKLPDVRKREKLALSLGNKAAAALQKRGSGVPLLGRLGTGGRPGSKLSDAAKRLASSVRQGTSKTPAATSAMDTQLRASYAARTGTGRPPIAGRTPVPTPGWGRRQGTGSIHVGGSGSALTPSLETASRAAPSEGVTDGLLQ